MVTRILTSLLALVVVLGCLPGVQAGDKGYGRVGLNRHCDQSGCATTEQNYRIEMRTVERIIYEPVEETQTTTVYDVIWEQETIHESHTVPVTKYSEVPYTYHRKIVEPITREVPYTTYQTIPQTCTREVSHVEYVPVKETKIRTVPHTVYRTIQETKTRTVHCRVPRTITEVKTIQVRSGRWETVIVDSPKCTQKGCDQKGCDQKGCSTSCKVCKRVWVPHIEERQVPCTRVVFDLKASVQPYTVSRCIPETTTRQVQHTSTRMVPITSTQLVSFQTYRNVPVQRTRTVTCNITRTVPQTGVRTVPQVTYEEVPTTRVIDVPRKVPREVCYTVTKMVPRKTCVQVPVRVYENSCDPSQKGGSCQKSYDSLDKSMDEVHADGEDSVTRAVPGQQLNPSLQLASHSGGSAQMSAIAAFSAGLRQYRAGDDAAAVSLFSQAAAADPGNPRMLYYLAVAEWRSGQVASAERTAAKAKQLEESASIADWDRLMQPVQGPARQWIDDVRRSTSA